MAWNPTPDVAVARDAAARLGEIHGSIVRQCVTLFVTDDGTFGYASYGKDRSECREAKRLGDKLYDAAFRHFRDS